MGNVFGILFATPQEALPFRTSLLGAGASLERRRGGPKRPKGSFRASLNDHKIIVLVAGIGAAAASRGATALVHEDGVDWLVSAGVCGGLWEGLRLRDVLQAAAVLDENGRWWCAAPLISTDNRKASPRVDLVDARLYSMSSVLQTAKGKREVRGLTGADAVDMESAAIAALAAEIGIRYSALRCISDASDDSLPLDFSRYIDASGHLRVFSLLLGAAVRPWMFPGLMRLGERTKQASMRLAEVLASAIRASSFPCDDSLAEHAFNAVLIDHPPEDAGGANAGRGDYDLEGCNSRSLGITHVA
ncbi:MAG: hypothetical protein LC772_07445 [Chloroflexi bacterium]|nr:hypothetical protein [Chloroflexota bacterium]